MTRLPGYRLQDRQPVRLFETAMRQVAAPSQLHRLSVFDRLTTQAAQGNSAAAVTASAVVKQLRKSAAAASADSDGGCMYLKPVSELLTLQGLSRL